jgi:hypothetical protein
MLKRALCLTALTVIFGGPTFAQSEDVNVPATKADVEQYMEVTHAHDMAKQMMQAMTKPMHQMVHEQYLKDKDKLPLDFEAHTNKLMDDMMKDMPFEEMMKAMEPAYEKHFTRGDMRALTAFYSTPTGQKILHEMPAIVAEAMQDMMPIMQRYIASMQDRMQAEFAQAGNQPASAAH